MIGEYENFVLAIFQVVPLCFESLNNGEKLTVVNFVSSFGRNHFLWVNAYQVLSAQIIQS